MSADKLQMKSIEIQSNETYLRALFPAANRLLSLKENLMSCIAMEIRTMGLRGNAQASRVWKGAGEKIELYLPIPFLHGVGFLFSLG